MLTKTEELIEENGKLVLVTTTEERVEVTPEDLAQRETEKAREISYIENTIRVAQQQLAALRGEKTQAADLVVAAAVMQPAEVVMEKIR